MIPFNTTTDELIKLIESEQYSLSELQELILRDLDKLKELNKKYKIS